MFTYLKGKWQKNRKEETKDNGSSLRKLYNGIWETRVWGANLLLSHAMPSNIRKNPFSGPRLSANFSNLLKLTLQDIRIRINMLQYIK